MKEKDLIYTQYKNNKKEKDCDSLMTQKFYKDLKMISIRKGTGLLFGLDP